MSTRPPSWPGRSHISTFVHTLHLLDLDLLEDWPEVTIETFDSKSNLQHRLRCVEWSLYRFFELYDRRSTKDKLLPFFPPLTSLQFVNLRAALFRQLTDLKKNGRLGQNVVLRKTMLDECKGDKFEEMIATFSVLVLKRVKGTTETGSPITSLKSSHVVPLIISYRKHVQRDLEKRKELELRAKRLQHRLQTTIAALTAEEVELKKQKVPELPDNAATLRQIVRENWMGDNAWVEAILHAVPPTRSQQHEHISKNALEVDGYGGHSASGLLVDLTARVREQNVRLAHWQKRLEGLQQHRQTEFVDSTLVERTRPPRMSRFSRHQDLNAEIELESELEHGLKPRHAALITSLERELATPKHGSRPQDAWKSNKESARAEPSDHLLRLQVPVSRSQSNSASHRSQMDASNDETPSIRNGSSQAINSRNATDHEAAQSRTTSPAPAADGLSLTERTRASLAQYETPRAQVQRSRQPARPDDDDYSNTVSAPPAKPEPDRSSLLERTRQSMSLLTSALEDNPQSRKRSKMSRPLHSKSKSVNLPSQRQKLERAWSEESLASVAAKDEFDVDADYESVFKSRPKVAMSPNLSPQRNDLFNDFLEEGMKKLRIDSTPNY